jgi:hypothetical protein
MFLNEHNEIQLHINRGNTDPDAESVDSDDPNQNSGPGPNIGTPSTDAPDTDDDGEFPDETCVCA